MFVLQRECGENGERNGGGRDALDAFHEHPLALPKIDDQWEPVLAANNESEDCLFSHFLRGVPIPRTYIDGRGAARCCNIPERRIEHELSPIIGRLGPLRTTEWASRVMERIRNVVSGISIGFYFVCVCIFATLTMAQWLLATNHCSSPRVV